MKWISRTQYFSGFGFPNLGFLSSGGLQSPTGTASECLVPIAVKLNLVGSVQDTRNSAILALFPSSLQTSVIFLDNRIRHPHTCLFATENNMQTCCIQRELHTHTYLFATENTETCCIQRELHPHTYLFATENTQKCCIQWELWCILVLFFSLDLLLHQVFWWCLANFGQIWKINFTTEFSKFFYIR